MKASYILAAIWVTLLLLIASTPATGAELCENSAQEGFQLEDVEGGQTLLITNNEYSLAVPWNGQPFNHIELPITSTDMDLHTPILEVPAWLEWRIAATVLDWNVDPIEAQASDWEFHGEQAHLQYVHLAESTGRRGNLYPLVEDGEPVTDENGKQVWMASIYIGDTWTAPPWGGGYFPDLSAYIEIKVGFLTWEKQTLDVYPEFFVTPIQKGQHGRAAVHKRIEGDLFNPVYVREYVTTSDGENGSIAINLTLREECSVEPPGTRHSFTRGRFRNPG